MHIELPGNAERIIGIIKEHGHQAFVVGGCVRDSFLMRPVNDWDICTSAGPDNVTEILEGCGIRVVPTGIKHGTVTAVFCGESYEVTTFRADGEYRDSRHPENVVFIDDVKEDLARRDFTINAMAYDHEFGLIDPFGGIDDLKNGIIRCVGDPDKRFNEDALRILRCVRFASQLAGYGFGIEERTAHAVLENRHLLDKIAAERIREEFDKLMCGEGAYTVLRDNREIIAQFIPEIRPMFDLDQENPFHFYDVWMHSLNAVNNIAAHDPDELLVLKLAAFFHDIGKPACKIVTDGWGHFYGHEKKSALITDEVMRRLKYDNETRNAVVLLISKHGIVFNPDGKQAGRLLNRLGEKDLRRLISLERADVGAQHPDYVDERLDNIGSFERKVDELIADNKVFSMKDMEINGRDLMKLGLAEGKQIGEVKKKLLEKIIDGEIDNDKNELIRAAKLIITRGNS